jgi:GT2 family glycosyltransferase
MQLKSAMSESTVLAQRTPRPHRTSLLAVIVLHKMAVRDSLSYQTMLGAAERITPSRTRFKTLIVDNLPVSVSPPEMPSWIQYERVPQNRGLAAAYNRALDLAMADGFDWIVTLDQDSELPLNFVARIAEIAEASRPSPQIAAIVPQLVADGKMLSPMRFGFGAVPIWYPAGFAGTSDAKVFAFNSGAVLRVSALRQNRRVRRAFLARQQRHLDV